MAKTIAMNRGTASISDGTPVTIYTQSGGTATKIIFNELQFYRFSDYGSFSYPNMELVYSSNTGSRSMLAKMYVYSGSYSSFQFHPAAGQIITQPRDASYPNGAQNQSAISNGGSQSGTGAGTGTNSAMIPPANYAYFLNIPKEFFMGPGDSLIAKINQGGTTVAWSLTSITES
jgi:hypothetical protein